MATKQPKGPTTDNSNVLQGAFKAMSSLLDRARLAASAGLQFDGRRDLYSIFGYSRKVTPENLIARFARQDIAARIVNIYASATWSDPPLIKAAAPQFDEKWSALVKQQRIWPVFSRIDKLANLGRYGILLLGFDDTSAIEAPVAPAPDRKLLYIKPLAQVSAKIAQYDSSPMSSRFGLPLMYNISLSEANSNADAESNVIPFDNRMENLRVHWSRIVHVVEDPLETELLGNPRLLHIYNLLDDLLKVVGGTAETHWLSANRGIQADIDKEMQLDPGDTTELAAAMEEYQHQMRRILKTRGVKINVLGSDVVDPTGSFTMLMTMLAGATGIPRRILFGSEAGQLSSEQDRANWARRITERRMEFANPYVLVPFIHQCQLAGVLPDASMDSLEIIWNNAFHLSPLEKSQTSAQTARSVVNLSRQAVAGFPLVTQEEARIIIGLEGAIDQNAVEMTQLYIDATQAKIDLTESQADNDDEDGNDTEGTTREDVPDPELADRPSKLRE